MAVTWRKKTETDGQATPIWFQRSDGAYVYPDARSAGVDPFNPTARVWCAWGVDGLRLKTKDGKHRSFGRRWRSAHAAMAALDLELPKGKSKGQEGLGFK